MAKPRIFVSSTYYDLKHIRNALEGFIKQMGYEPVLFESGSIPFKHKVPLDISCYDEIENSHMQILIIGGRYGSPESEISEDEMKTISKNKMYEFYNSITKREYESADKKGIPIFVFAENGVLSEYDTYRLNRENASIKYAHVDSINVFKLLDDIWQKKAGNFTKGFDKIDDITNWLKEQWAGMFTDFLIRDKDKIELKQLQSQIKDLTLVSSALKEYSEAIMETIKPTDYKKLITKEDKKILDHRSHSIINESELLQYLKLICELTNSDEEIVEMIMKYKTLNGFVNNAKFHREVPKGFTKRKVPLNDYKTLRKRILHEIKKNEV